MQRSHLLRWLGLAIGLIGSTQCLDSISDDCTKTLTCEDAEQPRLMPNCQWEYPGGRIWAGGPRYDDETNTWRWPDGKPTATQNFQCDLTQAADAGSDGGSAGPDCRVPETPCDFPRVCDEATGNCYECLSDAECAGNMPMGDAGAFTVCDLGIHRCVECTENRNCSGDTPLCKLDSTSARLNACVECLGNGDCDDVPATPACDDTTNECTARCETTADCANGEKKACNVVRGLCVECTENSDCTTEGKGLCDTATNQCVECLNDSACTASGRVCDPESRSCVDCLGDATCAARPDGTVVPYCDLEDKRCVACLNDQQCTAGEASRCNLVLHQCAGCTSSSQCELGQQCKLGTGAGAAGLCVECLGDDDCTNADFPSCDTVDGRCVECVRSSECTGVDQARCDTSRNSPTRFTCVSCLINEDCTGDGKTLPPLCDLDRGGGVCSQCTVAQGAADCSPLGPTLSSCLNGTCAPCSVDTDCALHTATPACLPGVSCVECTDNGDCTDTAATPVCKTQNAPGAAVNTCVQCTTNADCQNNAEASLCFENQCVPCRADADCSSVDSNAGAIGGIPLALCDAGTCVECTGPRRDACGEDVCNSATRRCAIGRTFRGAEVCDECVSDFECATTARCVQHSFEGQAVGFFCFPLATGTPAACSGPRIFLGATTSATIDQEQPTPTVCQPRRTTCAALDDFAAAQGCDNSAGCGIANLDDGICDPALDLCTVPCASGADCADTCDLEAGACEL